MRKTSMQGKAQEKSLGSLGSFGRLAAAVALGLGLAAAGAPLAAQPVTIAVDASADRHPISSLVYGVAYGDAFTLADLNSPLNRQGGNPTTRYNWQVNADNRASDYFFESIQYDATPGGHGDDFIAASKAAGAQAMLTMPMIGWVAKVGPGGQNLSSFSIAKYGPRPPTIPSSSTRATESSRTG
jgi:Glycoside hydrolase family 44